MTEMVERVAWGIIEAHADHKALSAATYMKLARAAIAAMRQPTEAMLGAARGIEMLEACEGDLISRYPNDASIWRAMIDEALK